MSVFADIGGEPFRQKTITVIVLGDRFSGALAYALQSALDEPARIRVVVWRNLENAPRTSASRCRSAP